MKLLILANTNQQDEIKKRLINNSDSVVMTSAPDGLNDAYDVYFFLDRLPDVAFIGGVKDKVVFVNEVIETKEEMDYPPYVLRMNGWSGFIEREIWEVAGDVTPMAVDAATMLGRKLVQVKDVPGLVSARVIASIINEAYKALDEGISSKEEIDLALKLGTHYPFGPFEWCDKIGKENIYRLLTRMAAADSRYQPLFNL